MHIYVPLREQNRHMGGYGHVHIGEDLYPAIRDYSRPPHSYAAAGLNSTVGEVLLKMLPRHESMWTRDGGPNNFVFPQEILKAALDAHGLRVEGNVTLPPGVWP